MCAEIVDQISSLGDLVQDFDTSLKPSERDGLILSHLPGASVQKIANRNVITFGDYGILRKQITHLGHPWPGFKKRIQIPKIWREQFDSIASAGFQPKFIGVYAYDETCIFVDFEPTTYLTRKTNNSAAHVSTNDLYQAQVHGIFERIDRNGNTLTAVRGDIFKDYLSQGFQVINPRVEVFKKFNEEIMNDETIDGLSAIKEMHAVQWPDTFQGEWAGFYLEYRVDSFLRSLADSRGVSFVKTKQKGTLDFDLVFSGSRGIEFYGDLKASDTAKTEAPGNDAEDLEKCIQEYGKFWYVIYEHETFRAKDNADHATIQWNRWKDSVGYFASRRRPFKELSYASRFKEAVRFNKMMILEINPANKHLILGEFAQGRQPDGAARALKAMINKTNIDNFKVFSAQSAGDQTLDQ